MDFDLSGEQKLLKDTAHDFLAKECSKELVRSLDAGEKEFPPELWKKMADLGWMGLVIPEEYGGSGGSFLDLVILFEAIGYNICPSPLFSTVVLGSLPIISAGSEQQKKAILPGIASGELIVTMAIAEAEADYQASSIKAEARAIGKEYVVNGTKLLVPYASQADHILLTVRTRESKKNPGDGITIVILPKGTTGVAHTGLKTMVGDRPYEVALHEVRLMKNNILGKLNTGWPIVNDTMIKASVVLCAEMIGGAQAVMDMAMQYAKERTQFNRPIGSFQSIQNYFSDMWGDITGSSYLLHKAAWKISEGINAGMEAAMAKSRIGEAYRRITILGHQIFGGIGYTREHDMHLYHKRSITGDLNFGQSDFQMAKVAERLGL
ncbi:MAG: acyl-CoA dehydrogenase family protein [Syntrophales bacterium]|jgi:alkylation response protein AidB-like acyl-CoA dehydrogenase